MKTNVKYKPKWRSTPRLQMFVLLVAFLVACATTPTVPPDAWVKVAENYLFVSYINPDTISVDGSHRKVWELQDLKTRDRDGELSRRALMEYDCKRARVRAHFIKEHSGPMGTGNTLNTRNPTIKKWLDIPPRTMTEAVHRVVCAK